MDGLTGIEILVKCDRCLAMERAEKREKEYERVCKDYRSKNPELAAWAETNGAIARMYKEDLSMLPCKCQVARQLTLIPV